MHVSLTDVVLFLHIFVAIVTFGVAGILLVSLHQMKAATEMTVLASWQRVAGRCGPLFPALVLILIALGAWLIHLESANGISWSDGWVGAAVTGLVLMEAYGGIVLAPADKKLAELVASTSPGPIPHAIAEEVRAPKVWAGSYGNTFVALGILFTMPTKPTGPLAIAIVAVMGLIGIGVGLALAGRVPAEVPESAAVRVGSPAVEQQASA